MRLINLVDMLEVDRGFKTDVQAIKAVLAEKSEEYGSLKPMSDISDDLVQYVMEKMNVPEKIEVAPVEVPAAPKKKRTTKKTTADGETKKTTRKTAAKKTEEAAEAKAETEVKEAPKKAAEPKEEEKAAAPKAEPKKAEPKKTEPKKAEVKKEEPKKAEPKKEEAKKAEPKKVEPKKEEAVKTEAPKAEPSKEQPVKKQEKRPEAPKKNDSAREASKKDDSARKDRPQQDRKANSDNSDRKNNANRKPNSQNNQNDRRQNDNRSNNQNQKNNNRGNNNQKNNAAKQNAPKPQPKQPEEPTIKTVQLPESLSLSELADKLKTPVNAMIKKLFMEGKMVTVNTELSYEQAEEIALEFNFIAEPEEKIDLVEEALKDTEDAEDSMTSRPPVVCVMGHVDHGKTSLLDAIRHTSVTEGEAGGITQAIGAYVVNVGDQKITFLDTPGHEAFTAMRLRGAQATDIAILVVAADDGVMPQTIEAINHAKAAGIEIIVAVNKIDKPSANIERVKQELTEYGLIAEDWGGSTIFCPVSAHTKEGIDNLLDMILLTSEVLELKANKNRKARGVVIEARLDKGRGPVATLLVQKGTLHVGDCIAIGEFNGRVRAMLDHNHKNVKEATPSTPVEIIGLNGVPYSGDTFIATSNEKEARSISDAFITRGKENLIAETKSRMSLDDLFNQMHEGQLKELNIIIKADVQGSVEAVKQSLLKLSNEEVIIKCIHSGVGAINESDITLASASNAIVIGFNVRPDSQAKALSDQEKVDVRLYKVIYNAIDDIQSAMKGMLDPIFKEVVTGHAEVRQTFKASGVGIIAGSYALDGVIERGSSARVTRDGELVFDGKIASLKRFKDDAKEVKAGYEFGMVFDGFSEAREGDQVEVYKMVEVPRD